MHEVKITDKGFIISLYLSHGSNKNIFSTSCIDIICNKMISGKSSTAIITENKLFFKGNYTQLETGNNELKMIQIEHKDENLKVYNIIKIMDILRKHIPTVFDKRFVRKKNIENKIMQDFEQIYASACAILGKKEVDGMDFVKLRVKDRSESLDSYGIMDDTDLISDDIIEF